MPNLICQSCQSIIHVYTTVHMGVSLGLCEYCVRDKLGTDIIKARYSLIEKSLHESLI